MKNISNLPQFPLYIPTKGRYEYMITSKALTVMGINHSLIVEPQEIKLYQKSINEFNINAKIIELDMTYKEKYELCDNLGLTKSTGSGPARNFAWDDSIKKGHSYHWIMDDNIRNFIRINNNKKRYCKNPAFFKIMEDFILRYNNLYMVGPNYDFFVPQRSKRNALTLNTKIYSCNLIKNDIPFRWRGRYNEDVILTLDILKSGNCTVLFNALLQQKMVTQFLKGGNTDELYKGNEKKIGEKYSKNGTIDKSQMLANIHPDIAKVVYKFHRIHHSVNYTKFKKNKLKRKINYTLENKINNYNMELVKKE